MLFYSLSDKMNLDLETEKNISYTDVDIID